MKQRFNQVTAARYTISSNFVLSILGGDRGAEESDENFGTGVPVVVQWLTNPTRNHGIAGSVPALAQWVNYLALP